MDHCANWLYFRLTGFSLQCVPKCSPGILSVRPSPIHLDDLFIPFPLLSNFQYLLLHPHSEICLSLKTEALWKDPPQTSSLTSPTHWPLCPCSLPSLPWLRIKTSCAYLRPILPRLHCVPSPLSYSVASLQKKLCFLNSTFNFIFSSGLFHQITPWKHNVFTLRSKQKPFHSSLCLATVLFFFSLL